MVRVAWSRTATGQNMQPRRARYLCPDGTRSLLSSFRSLVGWACPYTVGTDWLTDFANAPWISCS